MEQVPTTLPVTHYGVEYSTVTKGRKPVAHTPGAVPKPIDFITPPPGSVDALKDFFAVDSTTRVDGTYVTGHRATNVTPVVYLARWVTDLFPPIERNNCISAAIILGCHKSGKLIAMPQLKILTRKGEKPYSYHHRLTGHNYERLWEFGKELGIQDCRCIIRTALYAGLALPGWQNGTYSDISRDALTIHEMVALLTAAGIRPARPDLIPADVYDDLRLEPLNAGIFVVQPPLADQEASLRGAEL